MARSVLAGIGLALLLLGGEPVQAKTSRQDALTAIEALRNWLDGSEHGPGWTRFLHLNELTEAVAQRAPDFDRLAELLEPFNGEASGLELPRFVAVRQSVQAWIATEAAARPELLPTAAQAARAAFRPVTAEDVERRRRKLIAELKNVDAYLRTGDPQRRTGWREYLQWEALEAELQSDSPNLGAVNQTFIRFRNAGGRIQRPAFLELREALYHYGRAAEYAQRTPLLKQTYFKQLEALRQALVDFQKDGRPEQALRLGQAAGGIRLLFQAPELLTAIQTHYWRPNGFVAVSERLASAGVNTVIQQDVPVSETVKGTQIVGQARFDATLNLRFVANRDRAAGEILLRGRAHSDNVGIRNKVRVYSVGLTRFEAVKPIYITPAGLTTAPAQATADTTSSITGVSHWLGLIRRVAGRIAEKARPEGEQIASNKVARQVEEQMDDRAQPLLQKANDALTDRLEVLLRNWDVYPRWVDVATSDQFLHLGALHVTPLHLAADSPPPSLATAADLSVRVHESLGANLAASILGGKKLTGVRIVELLKEFKLDIPEELRDPEGDPFEITFRETAPVTAEFRDDAIRLAIRGSGFKGRDKAGGPVEVKDDFEVWSSYRIEVAPDGTARLLRIGGIEAEFDEVRVGLPRARQTTILAILKTKSDALFKDQIDIPTFKLPQNWEKAGELRLRTASSSGGWLTLAWEQSVAAPYSFASE